MNNPVTFNESRLQWVDSIRGFSMLIVVLGHVLISMGIGGYASFLGSILLTFRMPLFFFVSGFFSYRVILWWNKNRITDILKRKVKAQILCTLAFLSVFQYVTQGGGRSDRRFRRILVYNRTFSNVFVLLGIISSVEADSY